jgi:hypothetical protein
MVSFETIDLRLVFDSVEGTFSVAMLREERRAVRTH